MGFLSAIAGTKAGRQLLMAAAGLLSVLAVIGEAYRRGRAAERQRQQDAAAKALQQRMESDDEINNLPRTERRRRLFGWVPDDG